MDLGHTKTVQSRLAEGSRWRNTSKTSGGDHRVHSSVGVEGTAQVCLDVGERPRTSAEGISTLVDQLGPSDPDRVALYALCRLQHLYILGEEKKLR